MFASTGLPWVRGLGWGRPLVLSGVTAPVLALGDGGVMGLEVVRAVEVLDGSVWLTEEGLDYEVRAGERWERRGKGKVVLLAVGPARVRLEG